MRGDFDLLETMRWTPEHGFFLLDRHLVRMGGSARHFGYTFEIASLREALDRAVTSATTPMRVRLLLSADGTARVECAAMAATEPAGAPARVTVAQAPIDPADEFLYHKTTNRRVYERATDALPAGRFDEVILWNPDRQVTESTIGNVVAEIGERKLTPPVACGLLPGTFRAQLLDDGAIDEGVITIDQLGAASRLWLINSVREWWPAVLG